MTDELDKLKELKYASNKNILNFIDELTKLLANNTDEDEIRVMICKVLLEEDNHISKAFKLGQKSIGIPIKDMNWARKEEQERTTREVVKIIEDEIYINNRMKEVNNYYRIAKKERRMLLDKLKSKIVW